MSEPDNKKPKLDAEANVIIQLESADGEAVGPPLDVPQSITPAQLETLLNGLLKNDEKLPYSFYLEDDELSGALGQKMIAKNLSVESALRVVYRPQALFRVRPVSRCSATMQGHSEAVLSVSFSPNGRQLASGSGDTTVRFWDLGTSTPKATCTGHTSWVLVVAWSPDNQWVASGDKDGMLLLWSAESFELSGRCQGHRKWITSMAWEPAHLELPCRRLVSGSKDNTIRVWDADTRDRPVTAPMEITEGGGRFYRQCLMTMSSHTNLISAVKWSGEGLILSASRDSTINVWDAKSGRLVRTLRGHAHWVNTLALSSEHALRTGAFDHRGQAPRSPADATAAAQERYRTATRGQPERLVSGSDDYTMFLWRPSVDNKPLQRMTGHQQLINQVQFSPDGRWVVSASFDKSVKLWNGETGAFVGTFRGHVGAVYQVSWSADSRLLVSGSKDSTLKVWDVKTKKLMVDLPGHADEVFTVDWSPDSAYVCSGGKDQVLKLWRH